jgi:hypothetical protein
MFVGFKYDFAWVRPLPTSNFLTIFFSIIATVLCLAAFQANSAQAQTDSVNNFGNLEAGKPIQQDFRGGAIHSFTFGAEAGFFEGNPLLPLC